MILQRFTWLSALLCVVQVQVEDMPTRCELQRRLLLICLHLLERVGGTFPLQCLRKGGSVLFPKTVFESRTKQKSVAVEKSIYTTLRYIDSMFDSDRLPDQWTVQESLDYFQHIIYRLIEENRCIMEKTQDTLDDFLSREALIRAYFEKMTTVLKEKDFHYCVWENVRYDILSALHFILKKDF